MCDLWLRHTRILPGADRDPETEPHPGTGHTVPVQLEHEVAGLIAETDREIASLEEGDPPLVGHADDAGVGDGLVIHGGDLSERFTAATEDADRGVSYRSSGSVTSFIISPSAVGDGQVRQFRAHHELERRFGAERTVSFVSEHRFPGEQCRKHEIEQRPLPRPVGDGDPQSI